MKYIVKANDTISKIARDVLNDMSRWPEIASMNNIVAPYIIRPGQVLQLPAFVPQTEPVIARPTTELTYPPGQEVPGGLPPFRLGPFAGLNVGDDGIASPFAAHRNNFAFNFSINQVLDFTVQMSVADGLTQSAFKYGMLELLQ